MRKKIWENHGSDYLLQSDKFGVFSAILAEFWPFQSKYVKQQKGHIFSKPAYLKAAYLAALLYTYSDN